MKKLASIGPLGLLIITGAQAQQIANPFSFRVGYSYLSNKNSGDLAKQSGYTLGIGYDFYELKSPKARVSLDIDWSDNDGNGNKIETGSAQVVARAPFSMGGGHGPEFYYGLGLGIFRSFVGSSSSVNTGSQIITTSNSDMVYTGGGELLLGARFDKMYSLEIYYRMMDSNSGVVPNTLGVVAAIHF